jgi:hypothetical protein
MAVNPKTRAAAFLRCFRALFTLMALSDSLV